MTHNNYKLIYLTIQIHFSLLLYKCILPVFHYTSVYFTRRGEFKWRGHFKRIFVFCLKVFIVRLLICLLVLFLFLSFCLFFGYFAEKERGWQGNGKMPSLGSKRGGKSKVRDQRLNDDGEREGDNRWWGMSAFDILQFSLIVRPKGRKQKK